MNEMEILNKDIGGMTLKEAGAMTFLQWVAGKLNNTPAFKASIVELQALVSNPPLSSKMSDDNKIAIIKLMQKAGIEI